MHGRTRRIDFGRQGLVSDRSRELPTLAGGEDEETERSGRHGDACDEIRSGRLERHASNARFEELGLSRDRARRENEKDLAALRERFGSLSPREREIVIEVARGRLSKQIAGDVGIAEATVKVHRSRAMRKLNARSLPELGRMVDKLKLAPEKPQIS